MMIGAAPGAYYVDVFARRVTWPSGWVTASGVLQGQVHVYSNHTTAAIRINENIGKILNSIVGITKDVRGTIVWAADEVVYAPEIAVTSVRVDEIAGFMEDLD